MSKIHKALHEMQKKNLAGNVLDPPETIGNVVEPTAADPPGRMIHIDQEALRASGFIAPEDEARILIDQFRYIKRPLVAHAFGKRATKVQDGHLILVTSALPGDGKTFTCINLALSMAREQDRSVLLVDADVVKGHISHLFGATEQPGLLDLLEEDCDLDLEDTILKTDIAGLSIMSAGKMRAHSTEMLASHRMERLIKALGTREPDRIVLFDSSPLLCTSEARVLGSLAGQVVLVVRSGSTPQGAVFEAINMIDKDRTLNLVLNQARGSADGGYYGYGYGYGGGYGGTSIGE